MQIIESEIPVLESSAALARILLAWQTQGSRRVGRPSRKSQAAQPASATIAPPPRAQLRHAAHARGVCSCGSCDRCRDNAKWERIFNEKFADPSYYGGISVRHNSALAGF